MYMHIYIFNIYIQYIVLFSVYVSIQKMELTENSNFRLFAANGKRETATFRLFAVNGNGKRQFVFPWSANNK